MGRARRLAELRFALAGLWFYRRFLSRFTPHCPQTPICSTYALRAVRRHGGRVGLQLALDRVRNCGLECTTDTKVTTS